MKKLFLMAAVQAALSTIACAGDVEFSLPSANDAFTIDQPAGTELMRVNGQGNVGIGTATPSDGTANGGKALKLDVEGAIGASSYCDENGENCKTILQLATPSAGDNLGNHIATKNLDLAANKLVGNGGTEGIAISNTGNVGIGTTTPAHALDVVGGVQPLRLERKGVDAWTFSIDANRLSFYNPSTDKFPIVMNKNGDVGIGTLGPTGRIDVQDNNGRLGLFGGATYLERNSGNVLVTRNTSTAGGNLSQIVMERGNGSGADMAITTEYDGAHGVQSLGIASGTTLLMSISKNGNVGINTLVPTEKLHVSGGVKFEGLAAGSTGNYVCRDPSGVITHGGSCSTSDERLKKDIQPVTAALARIQQLQGVTYKWKDESRGTRTELGLIAQQVEKVVPEVVDTNNDALGTKSIRYENLVALLIEGMKEQQATIDGLQQRVTALEAKLK